MIRVNNEIINFKYFNDNTLRLSYLPGACYSEAKITWLYDNDEEMSYLYFLVKHLRNACGITRLTLTMPYVPHARKVYTINSLWRNIENVKVEVYNLW